MEGGCCSEGLQAWKFSPRQNNRGGEVQARTHGVPYGRELCTASAYRNLRREHRSGRRPQDNPSHPLTPLSLLRCSLPHALSLPPPRVLSSLGDGNPFLPFIPTRKLALKWTNCPVIVLFRLFSPSSVYKNGGDRVIIVIFPSIAPEARADRHPLMTLQRLPTRFVSNLGFLRLTRAPVLWIRRNLIISMKALFFFK